MIAHWGFPNSYGDPTSKAICITPPDTLDLTIGLDIILLKLSSSEILACVFLLSTAECIAIPGTYTHSVETKRVFSP